MIAVPFKIKYAFMYVTLNKGPKVNVDQNIRICCSISWWLTGSLSLSALKIVKSMAPPSGGITERLSVREVNEG